MTHISFRKRSRSKESEFGEEFFPLSKRINSLQISGEFTFAQISMPNLSNYDQQSINHHISQHSSEQNKQDQSSSSAAASYSPELNLAQNPHYYRDNNVLYDLYLERMRRIGKEPYV